jgi:long-chain-acyl-CoA dehydrogenase
MFITNGWLADVVVVVAVTNKEAKSAAHGISLFLVDEDTPGFKKKLADKENRHGGICKFIF